MKIAAVKINQDKALQGFKEMSQTDNGNHDITMDVIGIAEVLQYLRGEGNLSPETIAGADAICKEIKHGIVKCACCGVHVTMPGPGKEPTAALTLLVAHPTVALETKPDEHQVLAGAACRKCTNKYKREKLGLMFLGGAGFHDGKVIK